MHTPFALNRVFATVSNFFFVAVLSAQAQTSSLVVPPAFENVDGANGSAVLREVIRLQEVYGASYFPNQPITIREIHFRPSTVAGRSFTSSIPDIQINLSTTTRSPGNLSATFDNNIGANNKVVFNGSIQLSSTFSGPASGPKGFDIIIPLTTPFVYDPAEGNLLIDFFNYSGSSVSWVDVAGSSSDQASRAISHNLNGTQATTLDTAADVLKIVFDALPEPPTIARGPYLQALTTSNLVVRWRTAQPTESQVLFGTSVSNLMLSAEDTVVTTEHSVVLEGLAPDTKYFYAIGSDAGIIAGGQGYHFTTPPVGPKATRIWAIGDCGTASWGSTAPLAVRDAYAGFTAERPTDVWLMLGDNAYFSGTDSEYQSAVFDVYQDFLRTTPVWSTLGNHETYAPGPGGQLAYFDIFTLPQDGRSGGVASGTERYYSFDYGDIHFVCMDSETSDKSPSGPMLTWLEQDLAANTKQWTIAFWHSPPYTKGSHDSDFEGNLVQMRQTVVPVLENYGVDLVLGGHSHSYERSFLLNGHYGTSGSLASSMIKNGGSGRQEETGVYLKSATGDAQGAVYVVAGSAGQTSGGPLNHPAMFASLNELGSMVIDVETNRMEVKFLRETGEVEDHFTIIKGSDTPVAPTIVSDPESQSVPIGGTAEFSVGVEGTAPFTYQWLFSGDILSGETNSTLVLSDVQPSQSGNYSVRVANDTGFVVSGQATLTVHSAAPVVISGLAVMGTRTNGNWTGDSRWNTVGNDNVVSFFLTESDDFFAPFINGPADAQAAVSIPLSYGTHTFTFYLPGGISNSLHGLNIFFGGSNFYPGISAFAPTQVSGTPPPFRANGAPNSQSLAGQTVAAANSLIYSNATSVITLTEFSVAADFVFTQDRVGFVPFGQAFVGSDDRLDRVGRFTLTVAPLPTSPPPAVVTISGLAVMGTQTNGNWTGDSRWNTVGNDNVVSFFVTKGDDFFAPFINGPAESQAAVSIPLSFGTHTFTFYLPAGISNASHGLNIFFDGGNLNPRISVFAPTQVGDTTPPFFVNGAPSSQSLGGQTVPAANSLSFSNADCVVTLTEFSVAADFVYSQDRVGYFPSGQTFVGTDGRLDRVGQFTLSVSPPPTNPPPATVASISGLAVMGTQTSGNWSGDSRWNTVGNDNVVSFFVTSGDDFFAPFINGPADSQAAVSIPLSYGTHTFTFYLPGGVSNSLHGLNIFFGGSNLNPGISAYGFTQVSDHAPPFFVNGAPNSQSLGGQTVPAANSLSFRNAGSVVTLTEFSVAADFIYSQDRVGFVPFGQAFVGEDNRLDRVGRFTLNVSPRSTNDIPLSCAPAPDGLVAWWTGNGSPHDAVGANHGSLLNGATYALAKVGQGFAFPGHSNNAVRIAANPSLDVGAGLGFTIETWINPADLSVRSPLMEWNHGGAGIVTWGPHLYILRPDEFDLGAGNLYANLTDVDDNWHQIMAPGGTVQANTWQHVALTYDRDTGVARLFRNGQIVGEENLGSFTPRTSYDLYLGNRPAGDGMVGYNGLMDEPAIYNRALAASEILAIATAGAAGKCHPLPPDPGSFVSNGGFELGINPGFSADVSAPDTATITGWSVEAASVDYIGTRWTAGDGVRCLDLSGTDAGTISQMISGLTPGNGYRLSFLMAANPEVGPITARLVASIAGVSQEYSFLQAGFSTGNLGWTQKTMDFTASAPTHKLSFVSLNPGWAGAALDKVAITGLATPPPPPTNNLPPALVYDASDDFSRTSNPAGPWSYGHLETLAGPFTLLGFEKDFYTLNGVAVSGWQVTDSLAPGVYRLMGNSTGISAGGAFVAAPGTMWIFAGNTGTPRNFGVIRFRVPAGRSGVYRVETAVRSVYDGALSADGEFRVSRNGQELFGQFIPANSGTGYSNAMALAAGDTVDFAVGRGASGLVDRSGLKIAARLLLVTNAPPSETAPAIVTHPASQTVARGQTATFSVTATGTAPLTYQWRFRGTNLPGATQPSLVLSNVQPNRAGNYLVVVANALGSATSAVAVLTVSTNAGLIIPPQLANVDGGGATLTLSQTLRMQEVYRSTMFPAGPIVIRELRFRPSAVLGGAFSTTIADLQLNLSTTAAEPDALSHTFANNVGPNNTQVFRGPLNVSSAFTGPSGGPKAFDIVVPLTTPFVYDPAAGNLLVEWRNYSGAPVMIATDGSSLGNDGASRLIAFSATANNAAAADTGSDVLLVGFTTEPVGPSSPSIVSQPVNQTVPQGSTAVFNVTATGTAPLTYQWRFGDAPISGATGSSLMLSNVQPTQSGSYSVRIENPHGFAVSTPALLIVATNPTNPALIIPPQLANVDGGGATLTLSQVLRMQEVYRSTMFPAQPIVIRELRFRPSAVLGGAFSTHLPDLQLNLSTTLAQPDALNSTFANNVGTNDTLVFRGPLDVASAFAGPANDPKAFDIVVPLTTPFYYDPAAGNLLVEWRNHGGAPVSIATDGSSLGNDGASRLIAFSATATTAAAADTGADVLQVVYTPTSNAVAPIIVTQPADRNVPVGFTAIFNVGVAGTPPFTYQWRFNGANLADATKSTLILSNVQPAQAGNYSVVVANASGSATSAVAVLSINLPAPTVRVVSVTAAPGGGTAVPIELLARGNENALGFSLHFNSGFLGFNGAVLGPNAPSGATLIVNDQEAAAGRVGLAVALAAGATFNPGTQQVVVVNFNVAPSTSATTTPVAFGDLPTVRQVSDAQAQVIGAVFTSGNVSITETDFEGDVASRPNGNRALTITDWVQAGRFVANLDTISSAAEFQRADSAPRGDRGNGVISITDWVQAGRYAVGLDPLTPVGGPTAPIAPAGGGAEGGFQPAGGRTLSAGSISIGESLTSVVPVTLESAGNENALGFTVAFDASKLEFVAAEAGTGANGATLNLNVTHAATGRVGLALALSPGASLPAGIREVAKLQFRAKAGAASTSEITFGDAPIYRETSDSQANSLATVYAAGTVTITATGPALSLVRSGGTLLVSWRANAGEFKLEATSNLDGGTWTEVTGVIPFGDQQIAAVSLEGGRKFFRLRKP